MEKEKKELTPEEKEAEEKRKKQLQILVRYGMVYTPEYYRQQYEIQRPA